MKLSYDGWQELAQPFYEIVRKEPVPTAGVDAEATPLGGLLSTKIETPEQILIHDPKLQRGVCHEYLLFERFYSGGGHGEVGEIGFEVDHRRLHLLDMSQRYVSAKSRSQSRGLLIPHAAIGFASSVDPVVVSLELNSPAGRVLAAAHSALLAAGDSGRAGDTELMASTFVELLRRLMLQRDKDPSIGDEGDRALGLLMRDHIATELRNDELDAEQLARIFKVSRATVYRHFEADGGVRRYIRNRRLDRCFFELAGTEPSRGHVRAVAHRWHFNDAAQFNRAFRERFGMSPSECAVGPSTPTDRAELPVAELTRRWLREIGGN